MGVKRNLEESGILDNSVKITEDEAALYDRQIRLWGMECQKRLREAKIIVVGLNGVAAEVVKNLTLSGVKQITILDDTEVTPTDFTAQFFLSSDKLGKPRAESSVSAIRELNPNVNIDILSGDILTKRAESSVSAIRELNPNVSIDILSGDILTKSGAFFADFHAMVATDCSVDVLIKLDELCRDHSLQFYCTDTWGFYGFCFLDLQTHVFKNFTVTSENPKGAKKEKSERTTVEMTRKYCPLGPTLLTKVGKGLKKRVSKVFVLLHVVNHFREMFNRYPHPESREKDVEELKKLRGIVCEKLDYDASKITDEVLSSVFGQLSPVCAAVGGILANEIIKGISRSGLPVHNYFLFDGCESVGVNETIVE